MDHNKWWKILKEMGVPDPLICLLRNLYAGQEAMVRAGRGKTDWLNTVRRVSMTRLYSATLPIYLAIPWWLRWRRICLQCGRPGLDPWVGKIPWRREQLPTLVFLPGEFHGQRSLAGCSPQGPKELDMTLHFV